LCCPKSILIFHGLHDILQGKVLNLVELLDGIAMFIPFVSSGPPGRMLGILFDALHVTICAGVDTDDVGGYLVMAIAIFGGMTVFMQG